MQQHHGIDTARNSQQNSLPWAKQLPACNVVRNVFQKWDHEKMLAERLPAARSLPVPIVEIRKPKDRNPKIASSSVKFGLRISAFGFRKCC